MNEFLNPPQKASLATVLRMFEEELRQTERWLDEQQVEGILYLRQLNISPDHRRTVRERIATALAEIAVLAEKLGLEQEVEDLAGLIRGQMSITWANLIDSQSGKLKRYGEVHPDTTRNVDPHLERLAHIALELAELFENNPSK